MPEGIILRGVGGFYYVSSEQGKFECRARGLFRKNNITPLPGDITVFSITDSVTKTGYLEEICERKNSFVRPAVANITQLIAVISVNSPAPDLELMDKMLISAFIRDIKTILCINKSDLALSNEIDEIRNIYNKCGCEIICTSIVNNQGIHLLKGLLKDEVSVFAGQSGVGKSTLLNSITGKEIMETGSISTKLSRGKHTTRHAQLVDLDFGGYLVDTPGFSSFEMERVVSGELQYLYPEFTQYIYNCRFSGCMHFKEPGCAVKDAVEKGDIPYRRYKSYINFYQQTQLN